MNEVGLQILAVFKFIIAVTCGSIYSVAGMSNSWMRAWLMPWVCFLGIVGVSLFTGTFSFWYILYPVLLMGSLTVGYGDTSHLRRFFRDTLGLTPELAKVFTRAICGLLVASPAAVFGVVNGAWLLFVVHLVLYTSASVVFGVYNPFLSARDEEMVLGTLAVFLPLYMV